MSFRYINPGRAEFLACTSGVNVDGELYNPVNKVAFWQPEKVPGVLLAECPKELYLRFDVYLHNNYAETNKDIDIQICFDNTTGIMVQKYGSRWSISGLYKNSQYLNVYGEAGSSVNNVEEKTGLKLNKVNSLLFHMKEASEFYVNDGYMELWVNGKLKSERVCDVRFYEQKSIIIYSNIADGLLSNLIISDEPISHNEQLIRIPIKSVDTDMLDFGDGSYVATETGQKLLLTPDVSELIKNYGGASKITGLWIAGNPAYRTGSGIQSLTSYLKFGGDSEEEIEIKLLDTEKTATAQFSMKVTDVSLSEIEGIELGWKTGE